MEDMPKKQIPCLEGLFTMPPAEPRLIGNRCKSCGVIFFPKATSCRNPYCSKTEPLEEMLFGGRGTLFTFTVNYFQPPPPYHSPEPFVPYASGWVELPEGLKVQAMIVPGYDEKSLRIGMEMELMIDKLYEDEQGTEVMSWKYRPVSA